MLDLLREQEKTSFPSRESSFSGWEQSAVSSNLIATIRVSDNFGNQTNVTSSCSIALQTNLRNGLFVANNPVNWIDPTGEFVFVIAPAVPWMASAAASGMAALGLWELGTELRDEYERTNREKKQDKCDKMGGEDNDPNKGKGPPKGSPEYEKMRRELERQKRSTGRGGADNPPGGGDWF